MLEGSIWSLSKRVDLKNSKILSWLTGALRDPGERSQHFTGVNSDLGGRRGGPGPCFPRSQHFYRERDRLGHMWGLSLHPMDPPFSDSMTRSQGWPGERAHRSLLSVVGSSLQSRGESEVSDQSHLLSALTSCGTAQPRYN